MPDLSTIMFAQRVYRASLPCTRVLLLYTDLQVGLDLELRQRVTAE